MTVPADPEADGERSAWPAWTIHVNDRPAVYGWLLSVTAALAAGVVGGAAAYALTRRWGA